MGTTVVPVSDMCCCKRNSFVFANFNSTRNVKFKAQARVGIYAVVNY